MWQICQGSIKIYHGSASVMALREVHLGGILPVAAGVSLKK